MNRNPNAVDSFNYYAAKVEPGRASVLVLELFVDGILTDTDFGDRMDPMFCDMMAELLNRRLVRKGQHVSTYYLEQSQKASVA
jgi:hypothetical protein